LAYVWVERVPSAANVADAPSRRACPEYEAQGFRRLDVAQLGVQPF